MESGERSAIEVLSKLIDLAGRTSSGLARGAITIGAKSIERYAQNKNNIVTGENDIKKLRNAGEPLQVTKIDSLSINRLSESCKEFGIPMSIVKDNGENFMFYKQSDSKLLQMIMERVLSENLEKNQELENSNNPANLNIKKENVIREEEQLSLLKKENTVEVNPKDLSTIVYDKKEITTGKQNFKELKNSKEPVNLILVDKVYSEKFENIAKDLKIPMTIVKNNDNHFMMLKENDLSKFEVFATKTLFNNVENEKVVGNKEAEVKDVGQKALFIKLDNDDVAKVKREFKKQVISPSFVKDNDKTLMFYKKSDSKDVQQVMEKIALKNAEKTQNKSLQNGDNEVKPKESSNKEKKKTNVNPKNNIRNKVKEAEERLNSPSVEKTIDIVKEVPVAKPVER